MNERSGVATSPVTARARALVAERRPAALALGRRAGDLARDPSALVAELRVGLADLADPEYRDGQRRIAPGIGPTAGVRQPLLTALTAGLRAATRRDSSTTLLEIADRLLREELLELHWLALPLLERSIGRDPEVAWQLVRAEARRASDWISVDSLAHVAGRGILAEPYRWAELEQLVYSPSRWERRLVGSTIATIPFIDRTAGRDASVARRGLEIVAQLVGDSEPEVQKALSWALRSLSIVDPAATAAFLAREAELAARTTDGHRAWVIRDSLAKLPPAEAKTLRRVVDGIRRRPGAASTSSAARAAASFLDLGVAVPPAERPIAARP
jgi:3-methyladenine DNA glycosylase AlkD